MDLERARPRRRAHAGGGQQIEPPKELLGIPAGLHFVGVVTIGRPADDQRWSEVTSRRTQRRRPLEELVRWEHWSR